MKRWNLRSTWYVSGMLAILLTIGLLWLWATAGTRRLDDTLLDLDQSTDGTLLVAAGSVKLQLRSADDGAVMRTIDVMTSTIQSAAFSPDGRSIAAGSYDYTMMVWSIADGAVLASFALPLPPYPESPRDFQVRWSSDGRYLAAASQTTLTIWETEHWQTVWNVPNYTFSRQGNIAWSPTNHLLAATSIDGVLLLNLDTHTHTLISGREVSLVSWNPQGRWLAFSSTAGIDYAGSLTVWDTAQEEASMQVAFPPPHYLVESIAWSADGQRLATGVYAIPPRRFFVATSWPEGKSWIQLWEAQGPGQWTLGPELHTNNISHLLFSTDGTQLITGGLDNLAWLRLPK